MTAEDAAAATVENDVAKAEAPPAEVKNTDEGSKPATKKTVKAPKEKKPRSKTVPTHPPYLEVS